MRILALSLLALVIPLSFALGAPTTVRGADDMCTVPKLDTAKWMAVNTPDIDAMLPKGYGTSFTDGNNRVYKSGGRVIGVAWGESHIDQPQSFIDLAWSLTGNLHGYSGPLGGKSSSETHAQTSLCTTTIGGRKVEITTYMWDVANEALSIKEGMGKHYMAVARWSGIENHRAAYMWYSSDYKSDLMGMRSMFWTAKFAGLIGGSDAVAAAAVPVAAACLDTIPAPRGTIGEYLDTSLVAMLVNGASPPLPKSTTEFFMRFDSTGAVQKLGVTRSELTDAGQQQIAAIVGSNILPQKAGSITFLRIQVTVGDSVLGYKLVGLARCSE